MKDIFFSILPIFLITLMGSLIRRHWITSDEFWRGLEKLSYFLFFPVALFNYISTADISSSALIRLALALMVSTSIVAAWLVLYQRNSDMNKAEFTSVFQGATRYNSYIFFGLGSSLFGEEGLAIVAVISAYMIIFTNVISVVAFNAYIRPENLDSTSDIVMTFLKSLVSNPLIVASILGFLFNYSDLEMNLGIKKTLHNLSDATLALGLINVGSGLKFNMSSDYFYRIIFSGVVKLLVLPMVTTAVLMIFMIDGMPRAVGLLYSALPCASTAYILSKKLGGDADLMAAIITVTTILSVFTISLVMYSL